MRRLDRASVPAPACLARFRHGRDNWDDVTLEDRAAIRAQLGLLQASHCAYCECDLSNESHNPHIEHFVQRSRAPERAFVWENLFWSCSHDDRCGKHKDKVATSYQQGEILKPDHDDPRRYLYFTSDGGVVGRIDLDAEGQRRAEVTIRVFALDHQALVAARRASLAGPRGLVEAAQNDLPDDDERTQYLELVARDYEGSAFSAAILDLFGVAP